MSEKGGSLGKASLVLTTKDAGLNKGLGKSEGGIRAWAGGMKGKIAGVLAGVGTIIAGFAAGSKLTDRFGDLAATGKQAAAIGVASDQFMGLAEAAKIAGVEGEQFGTLLQKGQLKITEGSGDTAAALAQIGLTLGEMRGLSADEQFYRIADGMASVSDQGTRALVASKLFEEEGVKLLPVLGRGAAGLRSFVAEQKALGTALDQSDMDGVMSAAARMGDVQRRLDGVMNRLTVAAVPFLELGLDIADTVWSWLPAFQDVKTVGMATFQVIGQAGGYVWDTLKAGAGGVAIALAGWVGIAGKAMQMAGMAKEGADALRLGGDMATWGAQQIGSFGQSSAAVEKWFQAMGNKAPKIGEKLGTAAGAKIADAIAAEYRNNPALERGSADEYSARVRWETMQQTYEQQQAEAAKKTAANTAATNETLKQLPAKIAAAFGTTAPLRTV